MSAEQLPDSEFPKYLDGLLAIAGLSNAAAERVTGVDQTIIQKWRTGKTRPSIVRLRQLADGLGIPRSTMFVRAGLLESDDFDIDEIYLQLSESVARLPQPKRDTMRAHLRLILAGAEQELQNLDSFDSDEDTGGPARRYAA